MILKCAKVLAAPVVWSGKRKGKEKKRWKIGERNEKRERDGGLKKNVKGAYDGQFQKRKCHCIHAMGICLTTLRDSFYHQRCKIEMG